MSTRGAIGFYYKGKEKVGYNHFDSYFTGLGNDLLNYLKGKTKEELINVCNSIKLESEDDAWAVNKFNDDFRDYRTFLYDNVFCEYAYIINLDSNKLEVYKLIDNPINGRYFKDKRYKEYNKGLNLFKEIDLEKCFEGKVTFVKDDVIIK